MPQTPVQSVPAAAPAVEVPPHEPPPSYHPPHEPQPSYEPAQAYDTSAYDTPAAPSNRTAWVVVAVLALVGVLGLGGYYLMARPPALEGQLYTALDQGNLVTPEGYSAYDLYHQLATEKPGSKALGRAQARVAPLLRTETGSALQRWAERSEATDDDWARTARLAAWNLELSPSSPEAVAQDHYAKAQVAFRAGRVREARSAFEQAIAAQPGWNLPYNSLGVTFAKARDYASAAHWYEQAAERSPSWSFPHANLGGAYYNLGRYGDAENALLRAISLDGSRPGPHLTLGGVYEKLGRYDDAISELQTALNLDPNGTKGLNVSRVQRSMANLQNRLNAQQQYYYDDW